MIKTAVILAAGLGSRLGDRTIAKPKGFLEIEGESLIEMSIQKLIRSGIQRILIGTGYLAHEYENLMYMYPQISCVKSERFKETGSMFTLYNMKDEITEGFLLLESDLLYDQLGIDVLIHHSDSNVVLASDFTNSGDEVYIETDIHHNLLRMTKQKNELLSVYGELIGLSKISLDLYNSMCKYSDKCLEDNPKMDYEYVLTELSKDYDIYINKLINYTWCEIDDENHLNRALNDIYPKLKAKEIQYHHVKRNILLNPGPATTTDTVKYAQIVPDICPREEEFGDIMQFVSESLVEFVANTSDYVGILFGGSGTAMVEAMLSSVVDDGRLLIINNGAYGKRMCEIADAYKLNYVCYESAVDQALDIKAIEQMIVNSAEPIKFLSIVHHETTTGLLNNITLVGAVCKKYDVIMIVDTVSSFAGVPINMEEMNISFMASTSNKNIQGMAGVGFVIANRKRLDATRRTPKRNFYLNLYDQYSYFIKTKQMRFTPPVQTIYALHQAILEARKEGMGNRYDRYAKSWKTLINGLTDLGLKYLVSEDNHSKLITSIYEPKVEGYSFNEMHDYFYERGFTIYPGKVGNRDTFRIANIGDITYTDIERFLLLLGEYMRFIGFLR